MLPLILVGGGGHCLSVVEAAESSGMLIHGILDVPSDLGKELLPSRKVVGCDDDIPKLSNYFDFVNTIGFVSNPALRLKIAEKLNKSSCKLATIVASTANVSRYAKIGRGTVVLHHANINACANIGENCIINTSANIEHSVVIGDFTHVSTGAMINGDCKIGKRCFIGSGSVIANGIHICDDVIIGCGTVVIKDITESGTYVGNPARKIK